MGGGTLRSHQNTCLIHRKELIKKRLSEGRSEQPISFIVSNAKHSEDWAYFQQPIRRILISSQIKSKLFGYESVLSIKKNWEETLSELTQKGITKLVLLGGSKLISSFLLDDVIDELQITYTPHIIGGECTWFPTNINNCHLNLNDKNYWIIKETKLIGNNEFLIRYYKNKKSRKLKHFSYSKDNSK
tara:strand:- start:124 stop:684 length:561 start_codon:yes stop_codon:yes gene_type:complete